jgi:modification target Cys-rich repeat protein
MQVPLLGKALPLMAVSLVLVQCNGDTTEVVCADDLSTTDAGRKVQAFVDTSNALISAARDIDSQMLNACRGMAADLGIPASELEPEARNATSPGAATDAACLRVRTAIDDIIKKDLPANARLAVVYTPPVCTINGAAKLTCLQKCDPVLVKVTHLECTPGHAYGTCMANCTGRCTGSCMGGCMGSCTGACSGSCTGSCNGLCTGTCAARNADGTCYGTCTGTCMGTCDGACSGSCDASCSGSCTATCQGTCEGDCSLWVTPPQCTEVEEVVTEQECKTTCDARARFDATCTEPSLAVTYGTTHKPALDRLVFLALRNNYATLLAVGYRATAVVKDAAYGYADALENVQATARQVGLGAGACVVEAISAATAAAERVRISVNVSISFTASVTAMGGAAAQ